MNPYQYQQTNTYFAQTPGGLETLAEKELSSLGARKIRPGFRGLYFKADQKTLYGINYRARLLTRVLAPLVSFQCRDRNDLYRAAVAINWASLFGVQQTFGIFASVSGNTNLRHSKFAALCLKDGVVDFFRKKLGQRPNVDKRSPDIWLNLHVEKNAGTISMDTSGGSLHRRGYRRDQVEAPIQETVAAAILSIAEWKADRPLYDPMCGSGTLLCEAAIQACNTPAGFLREGFGFRYLPDFNKKIWQDVKMETDRRMVVLKKGMISGSDIQHQAVKAARANCKRLPHGNGIRIFRSDFRDLPGLEDHVIVCNPPYGLRLNKGEDLTSLYRSLGDFLKQRCRGARAYIYFGNRELLKSVGLKPSWKKPLRNAGLDGRLVKYEMY